MMGRGVMLPDRQKRIDAVWNWLVPLRIPNFSQTAWSSSAMIWAGCSSAWARITGPEIRTA